MKYLLILVALLISRASFAQQISYQEWQEQAKSDIRMLPEYGNVQKTPGQIEADEN